MSRSIRKKVSIVVSRIILLLIFLCIAVLFGTFIVHKIICVSDKYKLDKEGLANSVSAGDYDLNVSITGNRDGRYTLVGMAGFGSDDFSVTMQPLTKHLSDDNKIIMIDRAGYGLSDDTREPQTVEQIVGDYRQVLRNAGEKAPYVLIAHSIAGVYATYWVSRYPDEIEGIVFLDSTQLSDGTFSDEGQSGLSERVNILKCKAGLYRWSGSRHPDTLPDIYTAKQQKLSSALNRYRLKTFAQLSEDDLDARNCQIVWENISATDVPKVYICSSWGMTSRDDVREHCEFVNSLRKKSGESLLRYSDENADEKIARYNDVRQTVLQPYLDRLGNCELVLVPGDHNIYKQKPDECAQLITGFLDTLSKQQKQSCCQVIKP
ncbi:MAG: alpha/beta hydrolase [Oscillospiraceae bacterium]|nr:alpha/beta hydrolase [Oscillospiraceae bacterium]